MRRTITEIFRANDRRYGYRRIHVTGELIGEMSFFDRSVRSATVITKGPVEALVFSKEDFQEICHSSPRWTKRLLLSLASRIRLMIERLSAL